MIAAKSAPEEKIKQIKEYISSINKNIFQTQEAIATIEVVADAYDFEPETSLSCGIWSQKEMQKKKNSALDGVMEKNVTEKEGRVISFCLNVILATVILCYIVRVFYEYQVYLF